MRLHPQYCRANYQSNPSRSTAADEERLPLKGIVRLAIGFLFIAAFPGCTSTQVANNPPEESVSPVSASVIRVAPALMVQFPDVSRLEILSIDGEPDWTFPKISEDGRSVPPGKRVIELLWTSGFANLDSNIFSKAYGQFTVNMEPGKSYVAYAMKEGVRTAEAVRMWIVDAESGRTIDEMVSKIRW